MREFGHKGYILFSSGEHKGKYMNIVILSIYVVRKKNNVG